MSQNSRNNSSKSQEDEKDPRFNNFPIQDEDFLELCNNEESSGNMNYEAVVNVNQNRQKETHNETQIELNESQNDIYFREDLDKKIFNDSLKSKEEDILSDLNIEKISSIYTNGKKEMSKKEGSPILLLNRKRNLK